ncbi:hypothetical protein BN128_3057 [Cronobacter sakazakii 696]|nr:hypothetical protein BN128_3057 [Cronobacter sakazakii 696]
MWGPVDLIADVFVCSVRFRIEIKSDFATRILLIHIVNQLRTYR